MRAVLQSGHHPVLKQISNRFQITALCQLQVLIDKWLSDIGSSVRRDVVKCGDTSDPSSTADH